MTTYTPVRNRATWVTYTQAVGFGWFVFGFGPALSLLRDDLGISRSMASLHSVFMTIAGLIASLLIPRLIRTIGRGRILQASSFVMTLGMIIFCTGHVLPVTILGACVLSFGASGIVQGTNAFLNQQQGLAAPVAITEMNALAAGIGFLAPVCVGLGFSTGLGWQYGFAISGLILLTAELMRGSRVSQYGTPSHNAQDTTHHDNEGPLPKIFWWALVAMICTSGTEISMLLWGADLLHTQAHLAKGAASIALGCIVGGEFLGRVVGARVASRVDHEFLYRFSIMAALITFLGFWLAPHASLMVPLLALTGFGMGMHWPLGISRAMRASSGRPDRAAAFVSVGTGLAGGLAPVILGVTADHVGIHNAYALVPLFLLTASLSAYKFRVEVKDEIAVH